MTQPLEQQLDQMITGYWTSQAIYAAAKLGIADLLKDGPRTVAQLAEGSSTKRRSPVPTAASTGKYRNLLGVPTKGVFIDAGCRVFAKRCCRIKTSFGFVMLRATWSNWLAAQVSLEKEGMMIATDLGSKLNPAWAVAKSALADHHILAREFGLTPKSEGMKASVVEDELDEFLVND